MAQYRIFGLGLFEQDVDLPEGRWMFHCLSSDECWGVDEQGRYPPVRMRLDRDNGYRIAVVWPNMDDVPEDIRWKLK